MATAKSTISAEISDIQRRMAQIRHEMHQEVQGAVKGAQSLTDWRSLIRTYPWLSIGVAATVGYLVVPHRRREAPRMIAVNTAPQPIAQPDTLNQPAQARRNTWNTLGIAFSLLAPVAVRAAQNYALQHLEQWLRAHPLPPAETGRRHSSESGVTGQAVPLGPAVRFRDSH